MISEQILRERALLEMERYSTDLKYALSSFGERFRNYKVEHFQWTLDDLRCVKECADRISFLASRLDSKL